MKREGYPFVLVPGMGGWGESSGLTKVLPYWGFTKFDIIKTLNARGYETYAASVSTLGSAWDRACELYALIAGTRVDYGKVHSERFGHKRYGRSFEKPLVEGWGEKDENGRVRKVNLISHSFAAVSLRLLAVLLEDGCAEEREATTDGSLSPLFEGGHGGWIYSITTLCAPHNGTDLKPALPKPLQWVMKTAYCEVSRVSSDIPPLRRVYDAQLQHFGIGEKGSFLGLKEFRRFLESGDNVFYDVEVDGSRHINSMLRTLDDIYYFSFYVCGTKENAKGAQTPQLGVMMTVLLPMAYYMGLHTGVTPEGFEVDKSWEPNDGVVNTCSARSPEGEPAVDFDPANIRRGVWNVMPVIVGSHGSVIGWTTDKKSTMPLYCRHLRRIEELTRKDLAKEENYAEAQ